MTATASTDQERATSAVPADAAGLLRALAASEQRAKEEEIRKLRLVLRWADLHATDPADTSREHCFSSPKTLAGEGSPAIDEFCIPELAAMLGQTTDAVAGYLTEVVDLAHRLPRLWARVMAGEVAGWRARLIARETVPLTHEAAAFVDAETHWYAGRLTPSGLNRLLDAARVRHMPGLARAIEEASLDKRHVTIETDQVGLDGTLHVEADVAIPDGLAVAEAVRLGAERLKLLGSTDSLDGRRATALGDLARRQLALDLSADAAESAIPQTSAPAARPATEVVLHVHVPADAIAASGGDQEQRLTGRVEQVGGRVLTVEQIRGWCGRPDALVTVKPVVDLRDRLVHSGYRPSTRQREHVVLRDRTCTFPWCTRTARRCDVDHVIPYDHDAAAERRPQPGPTSTDNLMALCRRHHRLKTRGRWRVAMQSPGVVVWTSPHGRSYVRDHTGSRPTTPDAGAVRSRGRDRDRRRR